MLKPLEPVQPVGLTLPPVNLASTAALGVLLQGDGGALLLALPH